MARTWLKQLRVELSLTQAALAGAAGIKAARYSQIELGYCELRDEEIKALADTLKQTAEFIQSGENRLKPKGSEVDTAKAQAETASPAVPPIDAPSSSAIVPRGLSAAKTSEPSLNGKGSEDLSDPVNFSRMPPTEALVCGALPLAEFRNRLQQHIAFAAKVLHTSKVKPRVWIAWRDFNKEAQNVLRGSEFVPQTQADQKPVAIANQESSATLDKPASVSPQLRREKGNKNLFGHFVDVAKESLPVEKIDSLSALATAAKKQRPELGFMKHFKALAEAELSPSDFNGIVLEAARRHGA